MSERRAHEADRRSSMPSLRDLTRCFATTGRIEAIYLRPARGVAAIGVESAEAVEGRGLVGDRTADRDRSGSPIGNRQVTLIQAEHVPLIAAWSGRVDFDAAILRRNLVVAGINLVAMRSPFADQTFEVAIGSDALFVFIGDCSPCSKMDEALGPGGYNALRGHGGVTARVVRSGTVRVGDPVRVRVER